MSKSLRDQLVEAGLATKKQGKKANRQSQSKASLREKKSKVHNETTQKETEERKRAKKAQYEKVARDKQRAKEQNKKAAEKALRAEIKQIIVTNDQRGNKPNNDDVAYNFLHNKKVKKIFVPENQRDMLSRGELVVVNNDGIYHLVTKDVATSIAKRDPRRIIAHHSNPQNSEQNSELDEHYKKFQIPDDLDW